MRWPISFAVSGCPPWLIQEYNAGGGKGCPTEQ
jgi:hypothetical protein